MRNNINNVVNIPIMITVLFFSTINYLNGTFSLLMAMFVIANYIVCMRVPNGIRYVVQRTFRLGVFGIFSFFHFFFIVNVIKTKETNRETKENYSSNTGTRLWRENTNVEEPSFVYRFVIYR